MVMFIGLGLTIGSGRALAYDPVSLYGSMLPYYSIASAADYSSGTWKNRGASGKDLKQTTESKRPTLITSPVSGLPSLLLDGSDDFLQTDTFALDQPYATVLAYRVITYGTAGVHDIVADGCAIGTMAISAIASKTAMSCNAGAVNYNAAMANGVYVVGTFLFSGSSSAIRVNGSTVQAGTVNAGASNGFTLGALQNGTRSPNIEVASAAILKVGVGGVSLDELLKLERFMGRSCAVSF